MLNTNLTWDRLVNNEEAWVSAALFSHPDIYQQELEQVFARMWLFVGHESQILNAGDFVRSRMGEEQVIVTRGKDKRIYVLLNSCPHRGNMVCRYDMGHGLAFQCSFHGWTFGSDGKLINLPPGTEEEHAPDLHKEEWGMLQARVETFHGMIWANWDKAAPSFKDYLADCAPYLEAAVSDAEGDPDGLELAGGVMRWRVGMNWKVPMPDMDLTHGWITHRSMRGLGPVALEDTTREDRFRNSYHVWFKNGHTTNINLPGEGNQMRVGGGGRGGDGEGGGGGQGTSDVVQQYNRERAAKRRERLGLLSQIRELPHVFPNIGAVGRIIRVMNPQGPDACEMWSYILVDKNAPPEVKEQIVLSRQRISGPNGIQQKDDMENWFIQTRYSRGLMTRWALRQNNQLGMSKPLIDGPSTFGIPGNFHPHPTDENYRRFFERYRQVMEARDWDELKAQQPASLAAP
jgi:phenylpropionate dioxygenase-like ring-hydroxylating dioxygenase large terminal subunit